MTAIHGTKWSTKGRPANEGASNTLPLQLPMVAEHFPDVRDAYPATLNVMLMQPLLVIGFDHRTAPLDWRKDGSPPEVFDFLQVELEARGKKYDGWIYVAHDSPHRQHLASHEIILRSKIEIADGEHCIVHIPRACQFLPNGNRPVVVVP